MTTRKLKTLLGAALITGFFAASPAKADDGGAFVTFKTLKPSVALELAQAALKDCRDKGFQVAVAVVDRFGVTQVMLRDRYAGAHTPSTATRKAWTAASFRTGTLEMTQLVIDDPKFAGLQHVTNGLVLGGGVVIDAAGTLVGAVGISGAPSGLEDENCALAGIAAVEDQIAF